MLQISYADMLTKVDPLRNELKSLEIEAQASRIKVRNECFKAQRATFYANLKVLFSLFIHTVSRIACPPQLVSELIEAGQEFILERKKEKSNINLQRNYKRNK